MADDLCGRFFLTKDGPWSDDHLVDFEGDVFDFIATTTYQYAFGGILIGIRSNITSTGKFDLIDPDWSEKCMIYEINNAAFYGSTDEGPKPPEFPVFLDPDYCNNMQQIDPALGGWGDVTHITFIIQDCTVATEDATWGKIKALYAE
ncbi:MAG: hypothetical protein JSW58_00455 [Candidatus Latescibacterota bacterium]|nr:MAG: hypothetical protein JSW58_00455 [Candidatus Latescibacterota bacterium]